MPPGTAGNSLIKKITASTVPPHTKEASPYVGPQPFQRQDSGRFFGRTRETNQLLSLVIAHRVTVLYAPSGAGKTSLLNAAIIPRLEEKSFEVLPPTRVLGPAETADPDIKNINTYQALCRLEGEEESRNLAAYTISDYLQEQGAFLDKYGLTAPRVLIFDQFEEFFTAYPARWQEREAFFQQLKDALETEPLLRIILSLREDYLAQLEPYGRFLPDNLRRRFRLERMTPDAALEAVRGPLEGTSRTITEEAAEKLVAELRKIQVESAEGTITAVGRYIEPVQLQVVCQNLWQSLPDHITTITEQELATYGDVTQALSQFYETALRDTIRQPDIRIKEGDLRNWFEKQLITTAGTRSLLFQDNETGLTGGIANAAIHHLDREHHIIRGEFRSGSRWYELTHDRFIDPIIEANRHWREQTRQKRIRQFLISITAAGIIFILALVITLSLNAITEQNEAATAMAANLTGEAAFQLVRETSTTAAQQLATAAAAEQTATVEQQTAEAAIALQNATAEAIARNNEILATSVSEELAVSDPDLFLARAKTLFPGWTAEERLQSLLTLIQFNGNTYTQGALELFSSLNPAEKEELFKTPAEVDPEPLLALVELILPDYQSLSGHRFSVLSVAFSPDGQWLASGSEDQTIRLWDMDNLTADSIVLSGHEDGVWSVAFSPDGQWLGSSSLDQTVRLWNMSDLASEPLVLTGHQGWVRAVAFSPNGQWLASGSSDRTIRLWDMDNLTANPLVLSGHEDGIWSVVFSPDGQWLAAGGDDMTIRIWEMSNPSTDRFVFPGHQDSVLSVAFSPDEPWLASGSVDETVRLWHLEIPENDIEFSDHQDGVWSVSFSPDGQWLASSSEDRNIILRDFEALESDPIILSGHRLGVWSTAFSPDSKIMASGSVDRTIRLWNISLFPTIGIYICENPIIARYLSNNIDLYRDTIINQLPTNCIF